MECLTEQDLDALQRVARLAEENGHFKLATQCKLTIAENSPACKIEIIIKDGVPQV